MKLSIFRRRPTAVTYGIAAGLLAVGVQVFFSVRPPPAYGICMACHTRDMVNWVLSGLGIAHWEIAPVSVALPLLTTVGLFAGAWIAARRNGEFRVLLLGHRGRSFVYGILVMNAAILGLGCPTRLLLLGAYGEALALVAALAAAIGIFFGTQLLKRGILQ